MSDAMQHSELPKRKSWFARNWIWLVALAVLLPTLCCGGFVTLIVGGVMGAIKTSEPYEKSLELVQSDATVQRALGTPIEPGWLVLGELHISRGGTPTSGDADITYSVSGPSGDGDVHAVAQRSGDVWTFTELTVDVNGQLHDLTPDAPR